MVSILTTSHKSSNNNKGGELWEVIGMFTAFMVVMVSQVYTYLQTHRVTYIKCV